MSYSYVPAQNKFLKIIPIPPTKDFQKLSYQKTFTDSLQRAREIHQVFRAVQKQGYLAASIDSIENSGDTLRAYLQLNKKYKWVTLQNGITDEFMSAEIKSAVKNFSGTTFNPDKTYDLFNKIITVYENAGYPFASVKLDSLRLSNDSALNAILRVEKNKKIIIDSIITKGDLKISPAFIKNYLNIKPGNIYQEKYISRIDARLSEILFIKQSKPYELVLTEKYNKLVLHLDKKKASQFDGIIGALPDDKTGKVNFTGDVRINLINALNKAERIDLNWRSLTRQTQDLKVKLNFPFILSTPFGGDYDLKLYKRDTTFIDVNQNFSVIYSLIGRNQLKAFYGVRSSNLISTKQYQNATVLPAYADVSVKSYGLGANFEKLDYLFNPRRGYSVSINASAGTKEIKQNSQLNPELYKNLKLKSDQYIAEGYVSVYIPLYRKMTIKLANRFATTYNQSLFSNELHRMGGIKTLRGFDEESIWASTYSIQTIEWRFLFEKNSNMYVFADGAYYENKSLNYTGDRYDTPIGFGAGMSFETKAGIFSINYALGKQFNNPIQLRSGKIHFGVVNYF